VVDENKYLLDHSIIRMKAAYAIAMGYVKLYMDNFPDDEIEEAKTEAVVQTGLISQQAFQVLPPGYKPFRTYHTVTDRDIIVNEMQCTTAEMANEVHVMTPQDSTELWKKSVAGLKSVVGIDPDLSQTYWRTNICSFSMYQLPSEKLIRRIYEPNAHARHEQINIAYRDLAESMKSMYRGQIVMVGKRDIKPYDVVLLKDSYNRIYGGIDVESVTHNHSLEAGWTTTIVPHMMNHHAEMEDNKTMFWIQAGLGALDFGMNVYFSYKLISGGTRRFNETFGELKDSGITKKIALSATAVGFQDVAPNLLKMSLGSDGIGMVKELLTGDAATAAWFHTPTMNVLGKSMSQKDYNAALKTNGSGNVVTDNGTPIPDHFKPVVLSPVVKDGKPWLAGTKGIREKDHVGWSGITGSFIGQNFEAIGLGLHKTAHHVDVGIQRYSNYIDILRRNIFQ
jgi:hypothetical protein